MSHGQQAGQASDQANEGGQAGARGAGASHVAAASVTAGSWAIQYTCDGDEGEQWYPDLIKTIGVTDLYYLINRNSGLCLDVKGASMQPGTHVIQWYCNEGTNQQWFVSAPGI